MTAFLYDARGMTGRRLRSIIRQPAYVISTLVQPLMWLLLFGALFERVVDIPGFASTSYQDFLAPGVVVTSALFSGAWAGLGMVRDIEAGVMDRFLTTPVKRGAIAVGPVAYQGAVTVIQSLIVVAIAIPVGAKFEGGVLGVAVLILAAVLVGAGIGALSNAFSLITRREDSIVAVAATLTFPISMLAGTFMPLRLMPSWMADIARYNPVNWAVEGGRVASGADPDWGFVLARMGGLLVFAVVCAWLSVRAIRAYQRSL